MDIQTRFNEFIAYKGLSKRRFQYNIGVSNSYIQNIVNGISEDVLNRIKNVYPELNVDWLLTGEGEMLNSSIVQTNTNGDNINGNSVNITKTSEEKYLDIIKSQSEQLNRSQQQLSKSQEQIDRLLSLMEKMNG